MVTELYILEKSFFMSQIMSQSAGFRLRFGLGLGLVRFWGCFLGLGLGLGLPVFFLR